MSIGAAFCQNSTGCILGLGRADFDLKTCRSPVDSESALAFSPPSCYVSGRREAHKYALPHRKTPNNTDGMTSSSLTADVGGGG